MKSLKWLIFLLLALCLLVEGCALNAPTPEALYRDAVRGMIARDLTEFSGQRPDWLGIVTNELKTSGFEYDVTTTTNGWRVIARSP